jgi:phenol 2-monooxygenase
MAPSIFSFMKSSRSTTNSPPSSTRQKMASGLTTTDTDSRSAGSSIDVSSKYSQIRDDDYSSFMSDVIVVGAGPAGLMLA